MYVWIYKMYGHVDIILYIDILDTTETSEAKRKLFNFPKQQINVAL